MRWPISECRRAGDDHDTHNRRRQAENNEDGEIANPEEEMFRSKLAAIVVIGSLAGSLVGSLAWAQGADAPKNLHFAWQQATPTTTFWVGFDLKTFEAQGLKLDLTSFNDNAPELEALVAHQVDLAAVAPAPSLQAISFGAPLKIISAVEYSFTDQQGTHWSAVNLVGRKDAGVQSLKDLVGKRVAVFGLSSNFYLAICDRLHEAGIDPKSITFLSMPYPQMEGALVHGEVDAAIMTSIAAHHVAQRIPVNVLMASDQITRIPVDMSQVIVGRDDWMKAHEEETVRFLMGMLATRKIIQDDVDRNGGAKIKEITSRLLKYDPQTNEAFYKLRAASAGKELFMLNSLDLPKQSFVAYGRMLTSAGQLRGKPAAPPEQALDMSYLHKAYARLGMTWDDSKDGTKGAGQ
jgi:ABC-type nitrate/sulfonate/bicarbonate transport system substrate-binding protein